MSETLKLALIGGGAGSFIGRIHHRAAELDRNISLVAGCFGSSPERSRASATPYGVPVDRAYGDIAELIAKESARTDGARVVAIAAPNHVHFPAAMMAVQAGIAVLCDKPATLSRKEALELQQALNRVAVPYCLSYTYTGYPMVREARHLCASGALGNIRKCVVDYPQGWLARPVERQGSKQAEWRVDPEKAGVGGCSADIGTHAFNLIEFATGLRVTSLCAQLSSMVAGRTLDDDCNVLLELEGQVPAVIQASQIAAGSRNGIRLRVWGSDGGLDWSHEQSDRLVVEGVDGTTRILHAGAADLSPEAIAACRLPPGHPEGFIEALANIYSDFADVIIGANARPAGLLQGIDEGIRSMTFVEQAVRSSRERRWVEIAAEAKDVAA